MTQIIIAVIALAIGVAAGYMVRQFLARGKAASAEVRAKKMLDDAQKSAKEEVLNAKDKALKMVEDAQSDIKEGEEQAREMQKRLEKREGILDRRMDEVDAERDEIRKAADKVREAKSRVEEAREEAAVRLEKIAGLSQGQAKDVLVKLTEEKYKDDLSEKITELTRRGVEQWEQEANQILAQVIQKCSRSHASEALTTTVSIPNEEIKGKIIGKEGRNIRAFERVTGVEIIIDDTPDSVVISAFDAVRRETARITLEKLMADGRVHPAKVEEMFAQAEEEIDKNIREAGEAAAYEAGVAGLDPKLLYILGRLRYRTSYKQNVLLHSLEVSYLAAQLAMELGLDVKTARMAGLLHDIGKALDHEVQGTHVVIGIKVLEKFGIDQKVIDAMKSHHDEYPYASAEAYLVTAADAISAGRPGARKNTVENYIKRMEELEELVNNFNGVHKAFAISAGREVRVFVRPEQVDDFAALNLARDIAKKIEEDLTYPGEIKVNVIRENRSVEYAR